ncbi:DUF2585 family protein [Roseovarius indicus]|uniref:Uncharacterized protein n=1 Tax=Roseovarius indicus TaxID=540747 RepID=A0A0T5PER6_9RHOB|nr:DUF2585 family protein [Roseovarius indicus]KRS19664.1 hypothetical protein XM52_02145 [Roseovarius indicus]QEW28997.1 hypothetical protein RIdsm_04839 [Roseovarius indicus]SFD81547.1 Protein of unknown function [Roseovarius indicus]
MMQSRLPYVLTFLITVATGVALLAMGRAGVCPCGYVDVWGTIGTEEANQQFLDWYAPSHLLHGLLFYAALWLAVPRMAIGWRLVIATVVECGWEIVENTDAMIQRYRDTTVSADYVGDSVLNSVSDVVAMWVGFALARFVPVWVSVAVVIGFEVLTALVIRDGLALNILMLLWPLEAVKEWQGG